MSSESAPVAVDIFAGAGGLSEGLLSAGIHVAVAVEGHPDPALTHAFNHAGTSVLCGDLRKLAPDDLLSAVKKQTGQKNLDLVAGGPPCQGFSCAGKQDRKDSRNQLLKHFTRIVEHCKPRMFLFENVPGLALFDNGRTIRKLMDDFWRIGYRMYGIDNDSEYYPGEYPIVNSAWHGVPQLRRRLILIGWRPGQLSRDLEWSVAPTSNRGGGSVPEPEVSRAITVREAIGDLEFLPGGMESHEFVLKSTSAYQDSRRANTNILFNHLATKHRPHTISMFRKIGPGKTINSVATEFRSGKQRMRRLVADGVASAVLALPDDYIHYSRHRIPTVRELARLQSFDDDYVFMGKRTTSDAAHKVTCRSTRRSETRSHRYLQKPLGLPLSELSEGIRRTCENLSRGGNGMPC